MLIFGDCRSAWFLFIWRSRYSILTSLRQCKQHKLLKTCFLQSSLDGWCYTGSIRLLGTHQLLRERTEIHQQKGSRIKGSKNWGLHLGIAFGTNQSKFLTEPLVKEWKQGHAQRQIQCPFFRKSNFPQTWCFVMFHIKSCNLIQLA